MTLRITTQIYAGQARLVPATGNEGDGFESAVNSALECIRSISIGAELVRAIESAGLEVLIVKPGKDQSNLCVQSSQTEQACNDACYQEVLDHRQLRTKIQTLISRGTIVPGHAAIRKYEKFHCDSIHKTTHQRTEVPLAHKPKKDRPHSTDEILKNRIMLFEDKPQISEGIGLVRYLQNGLVGYHIMDHLTRGPGTGAWVVWDPLLVNTGAHLPAEKQAAWMNRPAWIALAHELIHGWRLACGCCVFRPSGLSEYYYEEAMTVGLPPYDQCRFTENRLRHFKGLPLRTFYGEATLNQSKRAALKHRAAGSNFRFSITVVGGGPRDPLVFDYEIRSAEKPGEIIRGTTDARGYAQALWIRGSEIRFRGFGVFGRVDTDWQEILPGRYMTLQFGRYRFICEPL
jgi:hypothetical protein